MHGSDIIIKLANKAAAVVVWRKDLYDKEAFPKLDDARYHEQLQSEPSDDYEIKITSVISDEVKSGTQEHSIPYRS